MTVYPLDTNHVSAMLKKTIAKFNNLIVLTADAHFDNISDLRIENWLI